MLCTRDGSTPTPVTTTVGRRLNKRSRIYIATEIVRSPRFHLMRFLCLTHAHTHTPTHTPTPTHTNTNTYTYTYTYTDTNAYTCTCTQTHTNTHTHIMRLLLPYWQFRLPICFSGKARRRRCCALGAGLRRRRSPQQWADVSTRDPAYTLQLK